MTKVNLNQIKAEDQLSHANLDYSEELYRAYLQDPSQVEDSWRYFFQGWSLGMGEAKSSQSLEKEMQVFQLLKAIGSMAA